MNAAPAKQKSALSWSKTIWAMVVAVAAFHLAYAHSSLAWLTVFYLGGLALLTGASSSWRAFFTGFLVGLGVFVPQLYFLWTLFGLTAIPLWLVLAFWIGFFVFLGHLARVHLGERWGMALLPVFWLGIEYFRSELYFLRFSWINAGFAFSEWPNIVSALGGVYGVGFWLMLLAALWLYPDLSFGKRTIASLGAMVVLGWFAGVRPALQMAYSGPPPKTIKVAGIQHEFPNESQVLGALDKLIAKHPDAELVVLSEYTFAGPVPNRVRDWCREHRRHLIVGGKDELPDKQYYNTAFVIGTNGEVVFKQGKRMPIQFYDDGLPAPTQQVWESPWGKIGICICYDFSFTGVTDGLIRQGAQAIIVPTMDIVEWGQHQHELHFRVAPVRAAEYHVPIFRVASSGISQLVSKHGIVTAQASFPGEGDTIAGQLTFRVPRTEPPHPPYDRLLGSVATLGTALMTAWLGISALRQKITQMILNKLAS